MAEAACEARRRALPPSLPGTSPSMRPARKASPAPTVSTTLTAPPGSVVGGAEVGAPPPPPPGRQQPGESGAGARVAQGQRAEVQVVVSRHHRRALDRVPGRRV